MRALIETQWPHLVAKLPPRKPNCELMAKAVKQLHEWRITEIRERGRILGRVRARTAGEAIEIATREFGITEPHRQKRLVATRSNEAHATCSTGTVAIRSGRPPSWRCSGALRPQAQSGRSGGSWAGRSHPTQSLTNMSRPPDTGPVSPLEDWPVRPLTVSSPTWRENQHEQEGSSSEAIRFSRHAILLGSRKISANRRASESQGFQSGRLKTSGETFKISLPLR